MQMRQSVVDKEQRRQLLQKKRKEKQKRIIVRNIILVWSSVLVILFIRGIAKNIGQEGKGENIFSNLKQEEVMNSVDSLEGYKIIKTREELDEGNLILVNDENPIRDYSDEELVNIWDYLQGICKVKSTDMRLEKNTVVALREMIIDFKKEVGENDLTIISGYRDFDTQEKLHYQSLEELELSDEIFVARPDRSEHHTGMAVDFGICYSDGTCAEYDGTGVYKWINENCYKYGFIMRYDEDKKDLTGIGYEPWHFRYVGKVHAQVMYELNLCLEEYIEFIKGYTHYVSPGQGITENTKNYSVYYISCVGDLTYIPLPISKTYSISGNNKDGFIVTVNLSEEKGQN